MGVPLNLFLEKMPAGRHRKLYILLGVGAPTILIYSPNETLQLIDSLSETIITLESLEREDCLFHVSMFSERSQIICREPAMFFAQAEDVADEPSDMVSGIHDKKVGVETNETIQFLDENLGTTVGWGYTSDPAQVADQAITNADLGSFLRRPVLIETLSWAVGGSPAALVSFEPWSVFFSDAAITRKIQNYSFIRCDLNIKIVLNGSPFLYGAAMLSYQPLQNNGAINVTPDVTSGGINYFNSFSQRPHVWISPQDGKGANLKLPFFFYKNWLQIQVLSDFANMGELTLLDFTGLQSANAQTGQTVTIQIFAWAENVEVSGPSIGLALQARDEYDGTVSKPASALAAFAGSLRSLPIIGSFATVTEMGAKAIAAGAAAIGYTNVPVISDVQPYKPRAFPNFASTEIGYPIDKLTLDCKAELSVDSTVYGGLPQDELAISYIAQKEAWFATMTWNTSSTADTLLFQGGIHPAIATNYESSSGQLYMSPSSMINSMFDFWRGDMILRFKVVASPFHKGRLRVTYDPAGNSTNISNTTTTTSSCFTTIVDIGKDTDFEMLIPYQQDLGWCTTLPMSEGRALWTVAPIPDFVHTPGVTNGSLTVRVLTELSAPVPTAPISVLVFARASSNVEFAGPRFALGEVNNQWSLFKAQARDEADVANITRIIAGSAPSISAKDRFLVNFGEAAVSLRQYLRRTAYSTTPWVQFNTGHGTIWTKIFSRLPVTFGYDPFGVSTAHQIVGTSTAKFNFSTVHPITFVSSCYVALRGSVDWHINPDSSYTVAAQNDGPYVVSSYRVYRQANSQAAESVIGIVTRESTDASLYPAAFMLAMDSGANGSSLTNEYTQAGLNVSIPQYNNYKFVGTNPSFTNSPFNNDNFSMAVLEVSLPACNSGFPVHMYAAIGTDFDCSYFLNVPTWFLYSSIPTPT